MTRWRRLAAWNEAGVWDQPHAVLLKKANRTAPAWAPSAESSNAPSPGFTASATY
ncbi:hypothetical protein GCM10010251_96700 [Streptomyces aurantiogriseus]|uniref:Uncharacterized protein n=1 Tax=Streptomyces aurantiogriseus TaxID=66870 RepID=A0A918L0U7_9ACTN|nr:hypothetical protein GCM10010251_96700 [Streptomyces aurantiogriseus]